MKPKLGLKVYGFHRTAGKQVAILLQDYYWKNVCTRTTRTDKELAKILHGDFETSLI